MSLEKLTSLDANLSSLNGIFGLNFNSNQKPRKQNNNKETASVINDEFCFTCNEGGNLINCDRCPASFHLLCHDPPLEIDQIPKGEFLCNKCRNHSKIGINPNENKNRSIHFEKYDTDSPLDTLCRMAESFNPKEMNLSSDLNLKCEFNIPGLTRIKWFANEYKLKTISTSKSPPNPIKQMCQVCSKFESSKKMIKCDYCESIYHQDCLFSLIDEIPTKEKIWMCPLHCEHILNSKFLKSEKLSDKIKLWNEFQINFKNDVNIEKDFIKKCLSKTLNNNLTERPIQPCQIPKNVKKSYEYKISSKNDQGSCLDDILTAGEALNYLSNKTNEFKIKIPTLDKNELVRPRALLKFISNDYDLFEYPIPLTKTSTTIGNSVKSDICLSNEAIKCEHLSGRHATIFYDYTTDKYEIMNYGEHGTKVDGVMLGFELEDEDEMASYEGSVELRHGSVIQMGCFKFLFVIIDYGFRFDLEKSNEIVNKSKINKKRLKKAETRAKQNVFKDNIIKKLNQIKETNLSTEGQNNLSLDSIGLCKFINNSNKKNLIC
ncbi:unnamed protein product [Brachionus calyciflorus]|uniref:PHD finger protein 12 n=1 Tax=Brachionus calyciflorus TaxID=104777 RepID=A0A813MNM1_9BILA|nr:unnamed protein product [Brachionus calyciflorus]